MDSTDQNFGQAPGVSYQNLVCVEDTFQTDESVIGNIFGEIQVWFSTGVGELGSSVAEDRVSALIAEHDKPSPLLYSIIMRPESLRTFGHGR